MCDQVDLLFWKKQVRQHVTFCLNSDVFSGVQSELKMLHICLVSDFFELSDSLVWLIVLTSYVWFECVSLVNVVILMHQLLLNNYCRVMIIQKSAYMIRCKKKLFL